MDKIAKSVSEDLSDQFLGYESHASTFNIALFGRTGVGKSSLVTAMGQLDGSRISTGLSDWTTQTEQIPWRGIQLFDTPGINGWGRSQSRDELERTARDAVETADVVLICFDNQNQQAEEFRKIASWVKEYGKPCIAILNVRNQKWRQEDPALPLEARRNVSRAVREHALNIQDHLASIGLPGTLVVALSAQLAVDALAVDPVEPFRTRVVRHRDQFGVEQLLQRSCLPRFEGFLSALLEQGAVDLRIAALRDGVRESLRRASAELQQVAKEASGLYAVADRTLGTSLAIIGYPPQAERSTQYGDNRLDHDLITEVENLRGEPYRASPQGELGAHVQELLTAHLHAPRGSALSRAEDLVGEAFDDQRTITAEEFADRVFREAEVEAAGRKVLDDACAFVKGKLALEFADAQADVEFEATAANIAGEAGQGARRFGKGVRAVGILAGLGASIYMLGGIAALNWWNPIGWVAGAVGVVATVLTIFGRRRVKDAEKQKAKARSKSLAMSRRVVHEAFDQYETNLAVLILDELRGLVSPSLRAVAEEAVGLKRALLILEGLDVELAEQISSIPSAPPCEAVVNQARRSVQGALKLPGGAPGVWLGEDWLHSAGIEQSRNDRPELDLESVLGSRLPEIEHIFASISEPAIQAWFEELSSVSVQRPAIRELLATLDNDHVDVRPGVAFVGDYSTGKTSLIKRLLVEAGQPVSPELLIGGHPVTSAGSRYAWGSIDLIDTPGAQSGLDGHEREAERTLAPCALGVFVFQPNVGVGDQSFLRHVLAETGAGLPLRRQSVYCLNRSDDLVGEPAEDPEAFVTQVISKTAELALFLERSVDARVRPESIAVVASDAFGLVGDRQGVGPEDYRDSRSWDGIRDLVGWLERGEATLKTKGRAVGRLRDACYRLSIRRGELDLAITSAEDRRRGIQRISAALSRSWREADILQQSLSADLAQLIRTHAADCQREVLEAVSKDEQQAALARLDSWWTDPALEEDLDRFARVAFERIEAWREATVSVLDRTLRSRAVRTAMPNLDASVPGQGGRESVSDAARALSSVAVMVKALGRDQVYKLGKAMKYNFKPWEAVKLGQKAAKVGAILGFIGVGLEAWSWAEDSRDERKREEWRKSLVNWVNETSGRATDFLIEDPDGPVSYLLETMAEVQSVVNDVIVELEDIDETLHVDRDEVADISRLIDDGRAIIERGGEY
jgi:predicted GTPase